MMTIESIERYVGQRHESEEGIIHAIDSRLQYLGSGGSSTNVISIVQDPEYGVAIFKRLTSHDLKKQGHNPLKEAHWMRKAEGIPGIPKIFREYRNGPWLKDSGGWDIPTDAILREFIPGELYRSEVHDSQGVGVKLEDLLSRLHKRGIKEGIDFKPECDVIVAPDGQPYMLDFEKCSPYTHPLKPVATFLSKAGAWVLGSYLIGALPMGLARYCNDAADFQRTGAVHVLGVSLDPQQKDLLVTRAVQQAPQIMDYVFGGFGQCAGISTATAGVFAGLLLLCLQNERKSRIGY